MPEQMKVLQRMPKELHVQLKAIAKESELSVNAVIVEACKIYQESYNAPTIKKQLEEIEARFEKLEKQIVNGTGTGVAVSNIAVVGNSAFEERLSLVERRLRAAHHRIDYLREHQNMPGGYYDCEWEEYEGEYDFKHPDEEDEDDSDDDAQEGES